MLKLYTTSELAHNLGFDSAQMLRNKIVDRGIGYLNEKNKLRLNNFIPREYFKLRSGIIYWTGAGERFLVESFIVNDNEPTREDDYAYSMDEVINIIQKTESMNSMTVIESLIEKGILEASDSSEDCNCSECN